MKMKISGLWSFVLKLHDRRHNDPGGWARDSLSDLDDQVWRDQSDDWQKFLSEKEESPAL